MLAFSLHYLAQFCCAALIAFQSVGDAEQGAAVRRCLTQSNTNKLVHKDQLEYAVFIRSVRESVLMIRYFGIHPTVKPHAIELLPDLEVFWSRHASKKHADKSEFKYALSKCFDAKCGNVSSYTQRLMVKPSLYEGKNCITLPLLALQKLIQCVDVKQNLKENRVFAGGYFFGCDEPQRNPRDTIFLTDTSDGEPFKVRNFAQLDLDDSPSFLKPFTLACVLYEQKANHGEKTELTTSSTNAFLLWQECAQGDDNDVYFEVGEPRESEGGGGSGSRSRKPGSGKVARRQLQRELERLQEPWRGPTFMYFRETAAPRSTILMHSKTV